MKNEELIKKLTLEEKANLMSGKDFWQTRDYLRHGIPSIFLSDGPHGLRKQGEANDNLGLNKSIPATCFPTAATMANSWDVKLGKELGVKLGQEAIAEKVNIVLGPGMNIKRSPLCGRNFEYFSEDPYLAGKMAASYIQGIQENGVGSCIKHFACNSQEENRMSTDSVVDERALREIYLTGFEIAVKEGHPKAIMSAYNLINEKYCNENKHLLVDILRKDWNYQGLVVTDWGACNSMVDGIKCYSSLEMPGEKDGKFEIIEAVKNGTLDEKILDENVDILLNTVFETEKAFQGDVKKEFDVEDHHAFARRAASESAVLLKNDGVLPLKDEKVALIGDFIFTPRYQGAGSSIVNPTKLDTIEDEAKNSSLNITSMVKGFNRYGKEDKKLLDEALNSANESDVAVIFLGLDEVTEAEGLDRESMHLQDNQIELVNEIKKTGKKVVVVLSCGSSVELPFADDVDAILYTCLNGQAGAGATLDLLSGKSNPSGKLSETFAKEFKDNPTSSYVPSHNRTLEYREGIYVGYRYYETKGVEVRYPFGHGLSYTTFEYSDLKIDDSGVTFKLKNTGSIFGKEVVQLYVSKKDSKIYRPRRELKGFVKVALEAGEEKEVRIDFDDKTFRYFDIDSNRFEVEGGTYTIEVASSSIDIRLVGELEVKGTKEDIKDRREELPAYYSCDVATVSDEQFKALLGRDIPDGSLPLTIKGKKKRIKVDYNTTVAELRYANGWTGRFFARVIRAVCKIFLKVGNKGLANTIEMSVVHLPMRGLNKMSGGAVRWKMLDGLMMMFDGHFHKGLGRLIKSLSETSKRDKLFSEEDMKRDIQLLSEDQLTDSEKKYKKKHSK